MLKLAVNLWQKSLEIKTFIKTAKDKPEPLRLVFDTGAYMTVIDSEVMSNAGYDLSTAEDVELSVVGQDNVFAKKILVKGLELVDVNGDKFSLGPIMAYAVDMSYGYIAGVLGLNVIREFETKIVFGNQTFIELSPTFDIDVEVRYEDFILSESRFGEWATSQVIS